MDRRLNLIAFTIHYFWCTISKRLAAIAHSFIFSFGHIFSSRIHSRSSFVYLTLCSLFFLFAVVLPVSKLLLVSVVYPFEFDVCMLWIDIDTNKQQHSSEMVFHLIFVDCCAVRYHKPSRHFDPRKKKHSEQWISIFL